MSDSKLRILIATVTAGAGHVQAAAALEEAWLKARPRDVVERRDLLTFFSPLHRRIYSEGYVKLVAHAPELWGMVFNKTDNPKLLQKLGRWRSRLGSASSRKFAAYAKEFAPDAVLCTHFLPVELLGRLRQKWPGAPPLTASIVTDFEAHALWMDANVDLYCVAAEETKARLAARGVAAERVLATGIPVAARFSAPVDTAAVRKANGWRDDAPILLVLGGGFGMGPVGKILEALDGVERPLQLVVVAGRNERLRRELAAADLRHPTRVLGFVNNMQELMAAAELIITKPGGLTVSEALAMGKPLFILDPIPGQESANSDFLLEHGAAAKANRVEDLPFRVGQLLGSDKLKEMSRAAAALGRPAAAADVCRAVVERWNARRIG